LQDAYVKSPVTNLANNIAAAMPRGRWANRVDDQSLVVKSLLDNSAMQGIYTYRLLTSLLCGLSHYKFLVYSCFLHILKCCYMQWVVSVVTQ